MKDNFEIDNFDPYHSKYFSLISCIMLLCLLFLLIKCGEDPVSRKGELIIIPKTLDFGDVLLGGKRKLTFTIENTFGSSQTLAFEIEGEDSVNFSLDTITGVYEIGEGQKDTFLIIFKPKSIAKFSTLLKINNKLAIELTGECTDSLKIKYSDEIIFFGTIPVGLVKEKTILIENISSEPIKIVPEISGRDKNSYEVGYYPSGSFMPGAIDSVVVRFMPTLVRTLTAILTIDLAKTVSFELFGLGSDVTTLQITPDNADFGSFKIGTQKEFTLNLVNLTYSPFKIEPDITGKDSSSFSLVYFPENEIPSLGEDSIVISFNPDEIRSYNALIYLDKNRFFKSYLAGAGLSLDKIIVTPDPIEFNEVDLGSEKDVVVSIKNTYSYQIIISDISFTYSVFTLKNPTMPISIPAVESTEILVSFKPGGTNIYSGKMIISINGEEDIKIDISGTGVGVPSGDILTAKEVFSPPVIDGNGSESAWSNAPELIILLVQVEPITQDKRTFQATLKAVYDNDYIYFLATVVDGTKNDTPDKFIFNGGDPSSQSNWTRSTNGQDGFSFVFPITDEITGKDNTTFSDAGCYTACHISENLMNFESGFYPLSGRIDVWYWKAGTTNPQGYADDYFAIGDNPNNPDKGNQRSGDEPGRTFSYQNFAPDGLPNIPQSVAGGDNNGYDKSKFIWMDTQGTFDPQGDNPATNKPWASGDVVPGWRVRVQTNPFTSRDDVEARGNYANGKWVIEFKRKLLTEISMNDDIMFSKDKEIPFSISYHENSKKYAEFEYTNLSYAPKPSHFGPESYKLILRFD